MLNHIVLIGRLTSDPKQAYTQSGIENSRFTLAVDRPFAGANGEKQTDFINIEAWRGVAESANKYLRKGLMTAVVGRLEIQQYTDKDGNRQRATKVIANEIRFLEWPKEDQQAQQEKVDPFKQFGGTEVPNDLPF